VSDDHGASGAEKSGGGRAASLAAFIDDLASEDPGLAAALAADRGHEALCEAARADLRRLRKLMELPQTEVARRLGATQPAVSAFENASGDVGLVALARYASALGLRPTIQFLPSADVQSDPERLRLVVDALTRLYERHVAEAEEGRGGPGGAVAMQAALAQITAAFFTRYALLQPAAE
jgi:transcriptional regulator with XRE-family HTH domain